jgi:uncharacterized protein YjbI with pentapeptide repeats
MDKFVDAQPEGADLSCARLQGASVTRAQLQGPHLIGAKLQGAHIDQAQSQGAHLWARGLKARRSLASAFGARGGGGTRNQSHRLSRTPRQGLSTFTEWA